MDDQRKTAYRLLIYRAMLSIRPIQWGGLHGWRAWSPIHCRRGARRIQYAGAVADWMHNLALFSALEFVGFNEEWFWRGMDQLRSSYPEYCVESLRTQFEQSLDEGSESKTTL